MVSKVLKVFYGEDYLPYKDSERTIHFPVGGNTFAGTQNTFRICFYPRDLVGSNDLVEQTSWVLVSKLPNGKLGYQLLNTIHTDSDLGEKYLVFDLSSYYSQYKGVVKLAIRGYQGEISFVEDEETHVYSVVGTPIIGVTGTIDIAINYSPMVYGEQLLPSELDQLVAKFSDYVSLAQWQDNWLNRIIVIGADLDDYSDYEEGQLFYRSDLHKVMILDNGSLEQFDFGYIQHGTLTTTDTLADLRDNYGLDKYFLLENSSASYLVKLTSGLPGRLNYTFIDIGGGRVWSSMIQQSTTIQQVLSSTPQEYATQSYVVSNYYNKSEVDNLLTQIEQREFQKVNTTTYPTLNDFLASEGEEGYIYLYPIDTSDETKGFYQYIWEDNEWVSLGTTQIDLSGYVEKTSSANKVYGTNELGAQTTYTVDDFYEGNIARRDSDGSITVPLTPTQNGHASSKKYVDDVAATKQDTLVSGTNIKTLNGTSLLGSGNYTFDSALNESSTNAVQNLVIAKDFKDIYYKIAIINESLFETVLTELPYKVNYATEYLVPSTLSDTDGTHRVVFSETQLDYFEGNGVVMNNRLENGNFESGAGWSSETGTSRSISNNVVTITTTVSNNGIYRSTNFQSAHKYLIVATVRTTDANVTNIKLGSVGSASVQMTVNNPTSTFTKNYGIFTCSANANSFYIFTSTPGTYEAKEVMLIDLTKMFGSGNEPTTTDDVRIQWLLSQGYIAYNTGEIKNTSVSGLTSKDSSDNTLATISFTPTELLGALSIHDTLSVVEGNVVEGEQRYNLIKTSNVGTYTFTGNETWYYQSNYNDHCYMYELSGAKSISSINTVANLISPEYPTISNTGNITASKGISLYINALRISDSSYVNNTNSFKAHMAGQTIQFEKATPIQTTIVTNLTFEQITLLIQEGGTIGVNFTNVPPNVQTKFVVKKAIGE